MAANPIIIPRHESHSHTTSEAPKPRKHTRKTHIYLWLLGIALVTSRSWRWEWITSGAAIQSLLIVRASFHDLHLWILLGILNGTFALSSTSWLLRPVFAVVCYQVIFFTCLFQFPAVSYAARKWLRRLLHGVHVFRDRIGFFTLPALEIDTQVTGRFVARGITLSLLDLTIEAHGLELGLRLSDTMELALCLDHLTIKLFRHIDITDVYSNLKVDENGQSLNDFQQFKANKHYNSNSKGIILHATTTTSDARDAFERQLNLRTRNLDHTDATGSKTLRQPSGVASDDSRAEEQYNDVVSQIEASSQIHIARRQIQQAKLSQQPRNEREMRQAVCAKLQDVPSVSHTPKYAVRVSVLQTIFPRVRRFLHRFPFFLRLLLNQLSYYHPINISTVSIAGSGEQLKRLLRDYMFKDQSSYDADMRQLEDEMSEWLGSASFCLEIADLAALGNVPLSGSGEITTYVRSANVSVYRTPLDSNTVRHVTHIGGADATFVLPAFLLPHHEHCLPPPNGEKQNPTTSDLDNTTPTTNGSDRKDEPTPDETELMVSVHASLPTHFDQSLVDFGSTLVKATKLIDIETLFERETGQQSTGSLGSESTDADEGSNPQSHNDQESQPNEQGGTDSKLSSRTRQFVKDGIKKGLKQNAVGDKINDRWVARTVGKIAARLENAQGDFGWTTTVPISLQPYRPTNELPSKILP